MKTRIIVASSLTVLSLGIATSAVLATSSNEEKPQVVKQSIQAPEVAETRAQEVIEESKETVFEQAPVQVQETPAAQPEYFDKSKLFEHTMIKLTSDLSGTHLSMKIAPITGAIVENYDTHKDLFLVGNVDSTIDKCVGHFKSLDQQAFQIALATNDCGL